MKTFLTFIGFTTAILSLFAAIISLKANTISYKQVTKGDNYITEDIRIGYAYKKVSFKVVYLMDTYKWELGREDQLSSGLNIDQAIKNTLPQVPNFNAAIGVIAVGAASQEGEKLNEEIRAENRADAIVSAIRSMGNLGTKEIYKLNLGQFQKTTQLNHEQTANQRRVIVIGIMDKPSNMQVSEIKQKLQLAFENSEELSLNVSNYSKFDFFKR